MTRAHAVARRCGRRAHGLGLIAAACAVLTACDWSPEPPAPGGAFRFAVFGDGPYSWDENGRARRVIEALNARPLEFVIHVGDIMWQPCTDAAYRERRALIERIRHPVVYTPGDNEWLDCVDIAFRTVDPLERLASLRSTFFAPPDRSLGEMPLALETQSADPRYAELVEHARWSHGGVLFITIHVVGGANGGRPFRGRERRHDEEVARRTQAALDWLRDGFRAAMDSDSAAVVVTLHASLVHEPSYAEGRAYTPIRDALVELSKQYGKPVLLVHGDEHQYIVDRPFTDPATGAPVSNLQRLETFGSPDIGWVDVVVDPKLAEPFRFEPNLTPRWLWW
jgi:hypothetical protein